jgi:hypothetical protein
MTNHDQELAGNPEMRNTVFGQVLAELLEQRRLPVTPFAVGKLAEDAGMDGWKLINRMARQDNEPPEDFGPLAAKLGLTEEEKLDLALAFTYERRA